MVVASTMDRVKNWAKKNNKTIHDKGFVIIAPPGSGKSFWVRKHQKDWVDADEIFKDLGIHTKEWHSTKHTEKEEEKHYRVCDQYLSIMKRAGLKIIGSLFWEYKADAIVLIDKNTHKSYVNKRNDLEWKSVEEIATFLKKFSKKKAIPVYTTIDDAAVSKSTHKASLHMYYFEQAMRQYGRC